MKAEKLVNEECRNIMIIEFPGPIEDSKKAISCLDRAMLGNAFNDMESSDKSKNFLEIGLIPNPENLYSRPIIGRLCKKKGFVLSLKVIHNPEDHIIKEFDILGIKISGNFFFGKNINRIELISSFNYVGKFLELADFIPPISLEGKPQIFHEAFHKEKDNLDLLENLSFDFFNSQDGNFEMLPPPIFSHNKTPIAISLDYYSSNNIPKNPIKFYLNINSKRDLKKFNIPDREISKLNNLIYLNFIERPIWSTQSLFNVISSKISIKKSELRRALRKSLYYYSNGPWRCCWVRSDYDPKMIPESRSYQSFEIRSSIRIFNTPIEKSHIIDENFDKNPIHHLIQYCDIKLPALKEIINDPKWISNKFSEKFGWWVNEFRAFLVSSIKSYWNDYFNALYEARITSGTSHKLAPQIYNSEKNQIKEINNITNYDLSKEIPDDENLSDFSLLENSSMSE